MRPLSERREMGPRLVVRHEPEIAPASLTPHNRVRMSAGAMLGWLLWMFAWGFLAGLLVGMQVRP